MTKLLWGLALIALLSVGYGVWRDHEASGWEEQAHTAVAQGRVKDAEAEVWKGEALRANRAADSLRALADRDTVRLPPVQKPDTTVRDSLRFWRDSARVAQFVAEQALGRVQIYRVALDSAKAAFGRLEGAGRLWKERGDSLEAVIARAPNPCPRILGLPVPKVGVGYALTTGGQGIGVAVVVPLGSCR